MGIGCVTVFADDDGLIARRIREGECIVASARTGAYLDGARLNAVAR